MGSFMPHYQSMTIVIDETKLSDNWINNESGQKVKNSFIFKKQIVKFMESVSYQLKQLFWLILNSLATVETNL